MKKIIGALVIVSLLGLTACSAKKDTVVEESKNKEVAGEETADVEEETNVEETANVDETAEQTKVEEGDQTKETNNKEDNKDRTEVYRVFEEQLGITEEQRNAFIEEYGTEEYEIALSSCKFFLKLNTNTVLNDDTLKPFEEKYKVEEVELPSSIDGHIIPADYITVDGDKNRDTVIFVHGQGGTRRTNLKIAEYFLEQGYNILTFDLRNSGENKALLTTFGAWEKYDLLDYVEYVDEQFTKEQRIIVWGCSYGGVVVATTLGEKKANEKIDAAILDSPVASMKKMLDVRMLQYVKKEELEGTYTCCNHFMQFMYGFTTDDADGVQAISKTQIPTLIITSDADRIVSKDNAQDLYDAIPIEKKYLKVFESTAHVDAFNSEKEEYTKLVNEFLEGSLFE